MGTGPRIILVAGIHRSGSTWVWGAARHLLTAAGQDTHAAWIDDYQSEDPAPVHLVKAHRPEEVTFTPDVILTTWRDRAASIASLIRMGWVKDTPQDIAASNDRLSRLYSHWDARTDLETRYDDILNAPAKAVGRIATALELSLSDDKIAEIADVLAKQDAPQTTHYDPVTLLHPGHRNTSVDQSALISRIATLIQVKPS